MVMAFKTIGYGVIGTITDVSKTGISDVADNGSICIDSDLKVSSQTLLILNTKQ
mgnify:CR=1 FL=1